MMGDHFAPASQLLTIVQSVVGPLREITNIRDARSKGSWEHHGQYRGRPIRIVLTHRHMSGSVGQLTGVDLCVSLGGRPLDLWLDLTAPGSKEGIALPNNQPSILPYVEVVGAPIEVVRRALDQGTTAAMRASAIACGVNALTTTNDWLCTFFRTADTGTPDAAALVRVLDFLFTSADRFTSTFDQAYAEAQRTGTTAQLLGAAALQRADRQRSSMVAVIVAILIMVAIVTLIIMLAVFVRC